MKTIHWNESLGRRNGLARRSLSLAFFLPSLNMGGAERVTVSLIKGLVAKGLRVDLVLVNRGVGAYTEEIPQPCRIIDLRAKRALTSLPALIRYLRRENPEVLIGVLSHINVTALLARIFAGTKVPVIVTEHHIFSLAHPYDERKSTSKFLPFLMRLLYPGSSFIVGVSWGVINDLKKALQLNPPKFRVIYNPIVDEDLFKKS